MYMCGCVSEKVPEKEAASLALRPGGSSVFIPRGEVKFSIAYSPLSSSKTRRGSSVLFVPYWPKACSLLQLETDCSRLFNLQVSL